jgi:4-diphosphocytidyl-2-C-methyl-D-erythritol kinase
VGRLVGNVFEDLLATTYPVVSDLKRRILAGEAYGAALSGTGPTVFGLMANEAAARKVASDLASMNEVEVLVSRTFAEER